MSKDRTMTWCPALGLALAVACLPPAAGAQPFTDDIVVASH